MQPGTKLLKIKQVSQYPLSLLIFIVIVFTISDFYEKDSPFRQDRKYKSCEPVLT